MIKASHDLRLGGGQVIAVPIPADHEAVGREVEAAVSEALREADRRGIAGAEVSPGGQLGGGDGWAICGRIVFGHQTFPAPQTQTPTHPLPTSRPRRSYLSAFAPTPGARA